MTDAPTPAGYVADAEEALGKARAMRDQAAFGVRIWDARVSALRIHLREIRAWADAGGKGKRPVKPKFDNE